MTTTSTCSNSFSSHFDNIKFNNQTRFQELCRILSCLLQLTQWEAKQTLES